MNLNKIELHDAVIVQTKISYPDQTVVIDIEYYPEGEKSDSRSKGVLYFIGVSKYSDTSNFDKLKQHAIAGNVSYWVPANGTGTTYIYLARGFMSITAKEVKMETNA